MRALIRNIREAADDLPECKFKRTVQLFLDNCELSNTDPDNPTVLISGQPAKQALLEILRFSDAKDLVALINYSTLVPDGYALSGLVEDRINVLSAVLQRTNQIKFRRNRFSDYFNRSWMK